MVHAERGIFDSDKGKSMCGEKGSVVKAESLDQITCIPCLRLVAKEYLDWNKTKRCDYDCGSCDDD